MKDDTLPVNHGKVVEINGEKVAIYKDADGNITTLSAVCTHMGCTVEWNGAEKSWDCPCHGSRFDSFGSVLSGPATLPLPTRKD